MIQQFAHRALVAVVLVASSMSQTPTPASNQQPAAPAAATAEQPALEQEDEILSRRIGRNELSAIEVCRAVVDAQLEYAAQDNSGRGAGEFAAKFVSAVGRRDGLYWPAVAGQPESPLGPLVADDAKEGYSRSGDPSKRQAYHGCYYRMLSAQGANAPGGALNYVVDGRITGGFAVLAEPAVYGVSGVVSFLVARDGIVYQRDLGPDTARAAAAITTYDPDPSWTIVRE